MNQSLVFILLVMSFKVFADSKKDLRAIALKIASETPVVVMSAAEKAQHQKWQAYLSDTGGTYANYPKEMCGKDFLMTLDPGVTVPFMKAGNDAAVYCEEVRTKLSTMCRNPADFKNNNKVKINKLVDKITCLIGSKEDEASFKLVDKELRASLGAKASNISEKLIEFMDAAPN